MADSVTGSVAGGAGLDVDESQALLIDGASVFDVRTGRMKPEMSVLARGGLIEAVAAADRC